MCDDARLSNLYYCFLFFSRFVYQLKPWRRPTWVSIWNPIMLYWKSWNLLLVKKESWWVMWMNCLTSCATKPRLFKTTTTTKVRRPFENLLVGTGAFVFVVWPHSLRFTFIFIAGVFYYSVYVLARSGFVVKSQCRWVGVVPLERDLDQYFNWSIGSSQTDSFLSVIPTAPFGSPLIFGIRCFITKGR